MKKKTIILAVILTLVGSGLKAQEWFDFSENSRATLGITLGAGGLGWGYTNYQSPYMDFGFGLSLSVGGLYIDCLYQSPEHRYDHIVTPIIWDDHTTLAINLGYQIPVLPWLRVTPLIGYANETTGKTIGNSVYMNVQSNSWYHSYKREHIYSHFNYGAGISVTLFKRVEIGAYATARATYGSVSFVFTR